MKVFITVIYIHTVLNLYSAVYATVLYVHPTFVAVACVKSSAHATHCTEMIAN